MLRRLAAFIYAIILILSLPVYAKDYDEEGAYLECCTLYPGFVAKVKAKGVSDAQILYYLSTVEDILGTYDEELSEENFDSYMYKAMKQAFNRRKNIPVRNALTAAFPEAAVNANENTVPEEFVPIYEAVKRYLFGITTPVVTFSANVSEGSRELLAHSVHLPDRARVILAVYSSDGTLLHAATVTPNSSEGVSCSCAEAFSAKVFAWAEGSVTPVCEAYEAIIE